MDAANREDMDAILCQALSGVEKARTELHSAVPPGWRGGAAALYSGKVTRVGADLMWLSGTISQAMDAARCEAQWAPPSTTDRQLGGFEGAR